MMVAFKTFSECPEEQRPEGVNLAWPWQEQYCLSETETLPLIEQGFTVLTMEQYAQYKKTVNPKVLVEGSIEAAIAFGQQLLKEFAAENVLLGITTSGLTGPVLVKLTGVMLALNGGSLYEAINRIKAIPSSDYDATFLTEPRIIGFLNKVEAYLGIPLTTSLS